MVKNLPASAGDVGSIPGTGKSAGEGDGNPLQYSCLGNPMVRGACQATAHGVRRVRQDLETEHEHQLSFKLQDSLNSNSKVN